MEIAKRLKERARKKGIPMVEFARRLGYSRNNLYLKLGRNHWTDEQLSAYCDALGVTYEIVFKDKETGERY